MDSKLGMLSRNGSSPDQWWNKPRQWCDSSHQAHQEAAVMQWELTLVEHESKFSEVVADSVKTSAMRAVLPKDILERFLDGPF